MPFAPTIAITKKENHRDPKDDDGPHSKARAVSLSDYLPENSAYFYSFPSGEDSGFYNGVPPWIEELVAARPLVCAGDQIKVVSFAAGAAAESRSLLTEAGISLLPENKIINLPEEITADVKGHSRNRLVKKALGKMIANQELVMAQPFLDEHLKNRFRIAPEITVWLNDKKNLTQYIPEKFYPSRLRSFGNGEEFAHAAVADIALPCVVKVSSSSAGDGVRICRTPAEWRKIKNDFRAIQNTIFVEQFIEAKHNFCIQFGIPADPRQDIDIIGYNEQLTASQGEFLGAVVDPNKNFPFMTKINEVLTGQVLPRVRKMGWYGVGGIDVLVDEGDKFFFMDSNFRMTATFVYVLSTINKIITKPIISFTGVFRGTIEAFRKKILPAATQGAANQLLSLVSITSEKDEFRFNGGMLFDQWETVSNNAQDLLSLGVGSAVLEKLRSKRDLF